MNRQLNMTEKTFLFMWPVMIVVALLVFLIGHEVNYMFGYLLGAFTALLSNSVYYRVMKAQAARDMKGFRNKMVLMYFVKFAIYGVVLYVASTSDKFNILFTFGGIFTYYVTLFVVSLIVSSKLAKEEAKHDR